MEQSGQQPNRSETPPPRAFTQGVGTVFQFAGGILFIALSLACCGSGLLGKETWKREDLMKVGWHLPGDAPDQPSYSALRATSVSLIGGIGLALAVAGLGLGLQATRKSAATAALWVTLAGLIFWAVHGIFFVRVMHAWMLGAIAFSLMLVFAVFYALAIAAWLEMRRNPPPAGHEILPEGYTVPYSWYHDDPPEVRLERELEQRRERLAVQQKELEMMEEKLRKQKEK
ncbi:MAG TPA: hypothetical protein VGP94_05670 [Tepidisphaeraceae bacterium]|nr:hypothetical protein [Tepidisphaeraceae bacterium]